MQIFCLVTYEYDSYSYSGISEHDRVYFTTTEKLNQFATQEGYRIVKFCQNPETQAIMEVIEVR